MKRFLAFLLLASPVLGQGSRHDNMAINTVTINGTPSLQAVQSAVITVCTGTVLPAPGTICTGLASIYSDPLLTNQIANPTNADIRGNYGFYTASGSYIVSVSGTFLQTYSYPLVQPCVNSGPCSGGTLASLPLSLTKDGFTHTLTAGTLTAPRTWQLQDTSDIFVMRSTADVLSNKTIDVSTNILKAFVNTAGHVLRNNGTRYIDAVLNASDLSNGVTGTGAVVLATSPTITNLTWNGSVAGTALQGNGAKIQTAGTNSGVAGALLCNDAGGAATTSSCTAASVKRFSFCPAGCTTTTTPCTTTNSSYDECDDVFTIPTMVGDFTAECIGRTPTDGSHAPPDTGRVYLQTPVVTATQVTCRTITTGATTAHWGRIDVVVTQ